MKRFERAKLFVIDYSFEARYPTFILADSMEDALDQHRKIFPSHHRSIKLVQFLSASPFITQKISQRDILDAVEQTPPQEEEESAP